MNDQALTHLAVCALVFFVGYHFGVKKTQTAAAAAAPADPAAWFDTFAGSWGR